MGGKMFRKKSLILTFSVLLIAVMAFTLSACGNEGQSLEGKNIVTFELNGGTLELKTSSVDTKINFAYHPGTYILDPAQIPGYKLFRQEYNFTGWYTSPECKPDEKWDFETPFDAETLTLYAGWEKAIKYSYGVYYVDGGESILLGTYDVKAGAAFDDWRKHAALRDGYTPMGYYSDKDLTTAWDASFAHPGGDVDTEIPVYVDYIEGEWKLVDEFSELRAALKAGNNVYLIANIVCNGAVLDTGSNYGGIFEGNGFTVSNFKVAKSGSLRPAVSIFKELSATAVIRNVSFTNVAYDFTGIKDGVKTRVAALTILSKGAQITNVSVSGTLTTNYAGELPRLNEVFFEEDSNGVTDIAGFTANVTIQVQN
jgi:hypothetical protein